MTPSKINRIYLVTFFGIFYCKYDFSVFAQWNLHSFWTFKMKFSVFKWKYDILDYVCLGPNCNQNIFNFKISEMFPKCLKLKNVWNKLGLNWAEFSSNWGWTLLQLNSNKLINKSSYWLNWLQKSIQLSTTFYYPQSPVDTSLH